MLQQEESSNPVHFPRNTSRFEFDEEVAAIFDNMAVRSIPLYAQAHAVHAMIAETHLRQQMKYAGKRFVSILDIGASVGGFLGAICNRFQCDPQIGVDGIHYHATDASAAMVEQFKHTYPWASAVCCEADTPVGVEGGFDVALLMYVLQFIPVPQRTDVLAEVYKSMCVGGILFLGQKEKVDQPIAPSYAMEYMRWRMDNGYTQKEINVKTRALESVMWVETYDDLLTRLKKVGFKHPRETTRWLQFSTLMVRK